MALVPKDTTREQDQGAVGLAEDNFSAIDVFLTGGDGPTRGCGYVWSCEDAFRLRKEFRLLGDFVGSLAKHTSQNQYLALPLVLSYEEVVYGAEQGFLRLLSDSPHGDYRAAKSPRSAVAAASAFYAAREAEFDRHAAAVVKTQEAERVRHLARTGTLPPESANGKKRSRAAKKRRRSGADDENGGDTGGDAATGGTTLGRPAKMRKVGEPGFFSRVGSVINWALHAVFPSVFQDPQAAIDERARVDAASAAEEAQERDKARRERAFAQARLTASTITPTEALAGERKHPTLALSIPRPIGVSEERLQLRRCVFRDLYAKGYYMSCGAKFGSDFLAYAGEPLLYHAALAVVVVRGDDPLSPLDVVALGRLGDATKKRTVLAYVDGDLTGDHLVRYVGVQWEETLP